MGLSKINRQWMKRLHSAARFIPSFSFLIPSFSFLIYHLSFIILLLSSCAKMGSPDGGWYDDTPPRVVGASPADKAVGVKAKKIYINFDEFIKIEDAQNKVIVSPPQLEQAEIKAAGKRIIVELKDSLKDNTTYTVDFSDAISDNNEGNPMGNYTYSFSTGQQIDTLEVSGYVVNAENLEPIKGILVGLYDNLSDTIFRKQPMMRVSRTDGSGHFVVKGVAPGSYRVYALQDADGDFVFNQKSEMLAFSHDTIVPTSKPDIRQDTIWRDSLRIDSIARVPYIHYLPDNIILKAFQEVQTDRYLLKTERLTPEKLGVFFSYGNDSLPTLRGLNFDSSNAFITEVNERKDSLSYWLRDTLLVNQDTLQVEMTYLMTDTLGNLVQQTDTIEFMAKQSYEKRLKDRAREYEKWQKEQNRLKKRGEAYDSILAPKPLLLKLSPAGALAPDQNILFEVPEPLERFDTAAIHLYTKIDTLWYRAPFEVERKSLRTFELRAEWRPGLEYSLELDSMAFQSIYGLSSPPLKRGLKVSALEDFSTLVVNVSGTSDSIVVVQLLNGQDNVVKEARVVDGSAEFYYVKPGKYYLRAYADLNGNGLWDTGSYDDDRQAEPVYYFPEEIECKAKWDITRGWNLTERPANRQKPAAITKQKPDQQKKLKNRNLDRAKQLGKQYIPR